MTATFARLTSLPLPAIAEGTDGCYFILARSDADTVLVQEVGRPPAQWTRNELAARWAGGLIVFTLRDTVSGSFSRFGLSWFLPVVAPFKRIFAEVLIISLFIQIAALATPLFFQVIIDKVLIHKGVSTLTVVMMALAGLALLEVTLGGLRTICLLTRRAVSMPSWVPSCFNTSRRCPSPILRRGRSARRSLGCVSSKISASS